MSKIEDYNQEVKNWDFGREELSEFLRLLSERNLYIREQTPAIDFHPDYTGPSKNTALIDTKNIKLLEHISFHVGFPHQKRLYTLINEETGNRTNEGVFFSLNPEDVVYFAEFERIPFSMVYFLDLDFAKEVRIQTKYDSSTISRYDLDYMLKAAGKSDKRTLRGMHRQLNQEWIRQNTIPLNIEQLEDFKRKGYDWLVVPDPIDVKD